MKNNMGRNLRQLSLFELFDNNPTKKMMDNNENNKEETILSNNDIERLKKYILDDYISDVKVLGLSKTWDLICSFVMTKRDSIPQLLEINNFGELYEIGLAIQDKMQKKKSGQYYTPDDVALVMSEWLSKCEGEAVCDVACGTGKLILTYLDYIGFNKARQLLASGNLYLYDLDKVALKICKTAIIIKYGIDIADSINDIYCDFLDQSIKLPANCKVISNPPYAKLDYFSNDWECTDVLLETRELYSCFMDKIFSQAISTVIITPFSFISGAKFFTLRENMCKLGNGFIVAFDNVPGNIFCGRKHGVFNTNTANSVRAAITVMKQSSNVFGYKVSPLIRFKNEEREKLLKCDILEKTLPDTYQIVNKHNKNFGKVEKELNDIFEAWVGKSTYVVRDWLSKNATNYVIDMPNTCRYYTTASARKLNRTGSIIINIDSEEQFYFLYCMINSSFAYWWWRIYDGGITYPSSLFNSMPLPFNLLKKDDKDFFEQVAKKMIIAEHNYTVTKLNAGARQENIKFPDKYRDIINDRILSILGCKQKSTIFKSVHSNRFFEVS